MVLLLLLPAVMPGARAAGPSPHGAAEGCLSCHTGDDPAAPGPVVDVVATCRSCHPTADMHPVGIPAGDLTLPAGWPLEDGLLTCATCHVEPAHVGRVAHAPAPGPSPWHRGGPYNKVTDLCYQCHERSTYTRQDPHHLGDPDAGTCAACHVAEPPQGATPEQARLRATPADACLPCHEGQAHAGVADHVGQVVAEGRGGALPLDAERRIQCFTCHDVHGGHGSATLSPLAAGLRERAQRIDWREVGEVRWPNHPDGAHPAMLADTVHADALCAACHGEGP